MTRESACSIALTRILAGHGIKHVVVSPGSRNAPILEAIDRNADLTSTVVIDERSAAFIALGVAQTSGECVALVCTSGTALLNYSPALAEAVARRIPILVITADRPHESIGRNEPQTIEQVGVYSNLLKYSFSVDCRDKDEYFELVVNDAIIKAKINSTPVHLNIEIPDPAVGVDCDIESLARTPVIVQYYNSPATLTTQQFKELSQRLASPCRVMIVAGCYHPSQRLNRAVSRLCSFGNTVTLADSMANLHGKGILTSVDTVLTGMNNAVLQSLRPDIVITYGGPMLSTYLKQTISEWNCEHWHVGVTDKTVATFNSPSMRVECDPESFFCGIVAAARKSNAGSDYTKRWIDAANSAVESAMTFINSAEWSDLTAVTQALSKTPHNCNLFLSNGMAVRYAQVLPLQFHRVDCNRGVSGIEGATSTAIGASLAYPHPTLLLTGDMSALYDP